MDFPSFPKIIRQPDWVWVDCRDMNTNGCQTFNGSLWGERYVFGTTTTNMMCCVFISHHAFKTFPLGHPGGHRVKGAVHELQCLSFKSSITQAERSHAGGELTVISVTQYLSSSCSTLAIISYRSQQSKYSCSSKTPLCIQFSNDVFYLWIKPFICKSVISP